MHCYTFTAGMLIHFTSILWNAVPLRFPGVKIAFLEIGATWLPYYLDRMDEHWEKRGEFEAPHLTKKPSALFRESPLYVSLEAEGDSCRRPSITLATTISCSRPIFRTGTASSPGTSSGCVSIPTCRARPRRRSPTTTGRSISN